MSCRQLTLDAATDSSEFASTQILLTLDMGPATKPATVKAQNVSRSVYSTRS